jgi:IclR family acetate operon transcriptional repressor
MQTSSVSGTVQSIDRALRLLEAIGELGGTASIAEISSRLNLPKGTVHRIAGTLGERGYVRQLSDRRYALGPGLIRIGEQATKMLGTWAMPALTALVDELGETANLATLDGSMVTYIAQVPSRYSMRTFTEVGRRVHPHSSGVGKALLAQLPDAQIRIALADNGMPRYTDTTITDESSFMKEIERIRMQHFAVDEGEYESGSRCFAVAVPARSISVALSVSGPAHRVKLENSERWISALHFAATRLASALDQ